MTNTYAEYIRILGRGPTKSRHLTREEAHFAFAGVLSGDMSDMQVGALLLLLRYRSESPEELAGIVTAIREHIASDSVLVGENDGSVAENLVDWPSYSSGRSRRLPWFLLSAKLLAENGIKVFMHGFNSHLENGLLTEECLEAVGEQAVGSVHEAKERLATENFVYLPLRNFSPKLKELLEIRSILGVRSIVNTAVKLVNPLGAKLTFLGIFHPAYITLNVAAANLLKQPSLGVIKGGGGEAERNILKPIKLYQIANGAEQISRWASLCDGPADYPVTCEYLADIWQGRCKDDYATQMIVGTAAQALYLTGRATNVEEAEKLALQYWHKHSEQ
ncbi:MAG: glycosyl transferase family protein [Emcibacter sp.]|nr:glycosyl transferase family protein [Emcibacter sp.]